MCQHRNRLAYAFYCPAAATLKADDYRRQMQEDTARHTAAAERRAAYLLQADKSAQQTDAFLASLTDDADARSLRERLG